MNEVFECTWCREANVEPTEYTFSASEFGGYDKTSGLPICENCANAAQEEHDEQ